MSSTGQDVARWSWPCRALRDSMNAFISVSAIMMQWSTRALIVASLTRPQDSSFATL